MLKPHLRAILFLAFLWQVCPAWADDSQSVKLPARQAKAIDQAIKAEMTKQKVVGVAIGIIQNGEIVYTKGYGFADRKKKIPVRTSTVFNWASNSKPLTAIAAMQLVDQKLLDLDEDVRRYVPEFPDKGVRITSRHLLCHQSGIPHYSNGNLIPTERDYKSNRPFLNPMNSLDRFNRSPLLFSPGTQVDYSSYAYILLSAVVQKAGKSQFDQQIQSRIAKPLGMKSLQLDLDSEGHADWAVGYVESEDQRIRPAPEEAHYWKHGAGGYKSNIRDFARWAQALVNHELVSKSAEQQMWTPQKTSDGKSTDWGLGFELGSEGGLKVSHNGSQSEATTRLVIYPKSREGVVVMCNCDFGEPGRFSTAVFSVLNDK